MTINRSKRAALKSIMLTACALPILTPNLFGQDKKTDMKGKKIVVIGAGISGLAAASSLQQRGANVIVLEANNYIGGRVRTDWSLGAPFEYGAGWIHGPSEDNPIKILGDRANSSYAITDDDSIEIMDISGNDMDEGLYDKIEDIWKEILYEIDEDTEGSYLDLINEYDADIWKNPNIRWIFSAFTEFDFGGSVREISPSLTQKMSGFPTADVVITSGYDKIIELLATGLQIRKNSIATEIDYDSSERVHVFTKNETFHCDYAICSVPLGVLKTNSVNFTPPLPKYFRDSIDKIGFGTVTKLALKFKKQFWDDDVQYYYTVAEETGRWPVWLNYKTFSDEKILLGLCMGDYARKADLMSEEELVEDALEMLKNVWEDDVGKIEKTLRTSWLTEPFSKGAYSFPRPDNSEEDFENLAEPLEDKLFFCGEHTTLEYLATTHGALLSGVRAAKEVIKVKRLNN